MSTKGIDCATPLNPITAKALAAAGYKYAARYLVPVGYKWKRLTRQEAEVITNAGMQIVSVFETEANRPAKGAAAGTADGAAALHEAQLIGQPRGSAIYFAVDYDAKPGAYDAIEAYLRHAAAEIPGYVVGVYGSYAVVEEMVRRIPGIRVWQTYAWSRGKKSSKANLYQYKNGQPMAGITVDLNESFGGEGWWNTKEDEEMSADDRKVMDALRNEVAGLRKMIEAATRKIPAPDWFVEEFGSTDLGGTIHEPRYTEEGWRAMAVPLREQRRASVKK